MGTRTDETIAETGPGRTRIRATGAFLWGCLAFALVWWVTDVPRLPAPNADSLTYMEAARSLISLGTPEIPFPQWDDSSPTARLSHFPPGVPVLIAVGMATGADPVTSARLVLAASGGLLAALLSGMGFAIAGAWGLVLVPALVLSSPELARLHVGIWSESPFLCLAVLGLFLMWTSPHRPLRYGITAGLASLLRYAGLPMVVLAGVVAWKSGGGKGRVRAALEAVAPGVVLTGAWMAYSSAGAGSVRTLGWYPEGLGDQLLRGTLAAAAWAWPGTGLLPGVAVLIGGGVALGATLRSGIRKGSERGGHEPAALCRLVLCMALLYGGFLLASRLVADPHIPYDERLLAPMMVPGLVLGASAVAMAAARSRARLLVVVGAAVWATWGVATTHAALPAARIDGMAYSHRFWDESPVLSELARYASASVYSNEPELLLFRLGVRARRLPRAGVPYEKTDLYRALRRDGTVVVLIPPLRAGEPSPDALVRGAGLRADGSDEGGWILTASTPDVSSEGARARP